MITAIDTNILLDILTGNAHAQAALTALDKAATQGALTVCEIVYSELAAAFEGDQSLLDSFLKDAGVQFQSSSPSTLAAAGAAWRTYRNQGGPRTRLLPDFLIGTHAQLLAHRLLTRDKDFYKTRFTTLTILSP